MAVFRVLKRILIPTGTTASLIWATSVKNRSEFEEQYGWENGIGECQCGHHVEEVSDNHGVPKKPSDLPLYNNNAKCTYYCKPSGAIKEPAGTRCQTCAEKAKENEMCEAESTGYKMGAIAGGGAAGVLLGYRGGIMRKLFLGTLGAGGVAYAIYPQETVDLAKGSYCFIKENGEKAYLNGRKFANTTYNWFVGPKFDPRCRPPTPKKECPTAIPPPPPPPQEECPPKPC